MTLIPEHVDTFFSTARERHSIYLRRKTGQKPPYTTDPIFQYWRFCNVFREIDKTTAWFREHVREPMRARPEVLLATVVFRFFNRIGTGGAIFQQIEIEPETGDRSTAWERFSMTGSTNHLKRAIVAYIGLRGPYVTGSYIVKTPEGFSKLDGVLEILRRFYSEKGSGDYESLWCQQAQLLLDYPGLGLEHISNWLESTFYYIGHFTAYEIVSDLRWTDLLSKAPDILTWANPGPGATRGLNYLHGRIRTKTPPKDQLVAEMRELLSMSRDSKYWPQGGKATTALEWPKWEMRECEHWLCETFKYIRARDTGQGPRQRFRP